MSEYKPRELRFYKPTSSGQGAASKFNLSYKEKQTKEGKKYGEWMLFFEMSKQGAKDDSGNDRFDWENAIKVKLGEADIGEMLAVLQGRKNTVGAKGSLYHQSPDGGNKSIALSVSDRGGYSLNVSAQDKDKKVTKLFHSLTDGEAAILQVLLQRAVEIIYEW